MVSSFFHSPIGLEQRFLRLLAQRYAYRFPRLDRPRYVSGEDGRAPFGSLNRSGMIALGFEFMHGNALGGDYFEFGSWGARTFRLAYEHHQTHFLNQMHFWVFDSFQGLPTLRAIDRHPVWKTGDYATTLEEFVAIAKEAGIPEADYTLVPGFYHDTLTASLQEALVAKTKAGLVYVDCDLYESTKEVLQFLRPLLQSGTVICFDDYYCFNGNPERGEQLAIREFLQEHPEIELVEYRPFGWHGKSFIVHVRANAVSGKP